MTGRERAGIRRLVSMRWVIAIALVTALSGCSGGDADGAPSPSSSTGAAEGATDPDPPRPDRRGGTAPGPSGSAMRARCALGEPSVLASELSSLHGVAIALGDRSRMVVGDHDHDTLLAIGSRVTEGAAPQRVPMPGADSLFALEAIDDDRFVVVTRTPCPEGYEQPFCLAARVLSAEARSLSDVALLPMPGRLRSVRVAASADTVWVARTSDGSQPALDRLVARPGTLETSSRTLGEHDASDTPTEILGLAVSGGSWGVIWRRGATEDARSDVLLTTSVDEHDVEALHHALVIESFQWSSGGFSIVAGMEFARPVFVRLGADGALRGPVRMLAPGEPLPPPFTTRRRLAVLGTNPPTAIEVRDGAGDAMAPRVPLDGVRFADVARQGEHFEVALARRDEDGRYAIEARELRCDDVRAD